MSFVTPHGRLLLRTYVRTDVKSNTNLHAVCSL